MFSATLKNYDEDQVFNELVRGFNEEKIPNNKLTLDEKKGIITFLSENEPSMNILRAMYHCGVVTMAWEDNKDSLATDDNVTNGKNGKSTNDAKTSNKNSAKGKRTSSKSVKTEKGDKKKKNDKTAETSKKTVKKVDEGGAMSIVLNILPRSILKLRKFQNYRNLFRMLILIPA